MISEKDYQSITKDIAGARTKNRFTYEMFYGIKKIYDLYLKNDDDFFVIFDYACDIEVGEENHIDFCQLKTTSENYTLGKLLHKTKNKDSILQTLVNLKNNSAVSSLFIVSNMGLKGVDTPKCKFSNMEMFCFSALDETTKQKINKKINWPSGKSELDSIYFCVSELCLKKPTPSLLGYTTQFLDSLYHGSPNSAQSFQTCVITKVKEKADYEFDTISLADVIKNKGITREEIEAILKDYLDEVVNSSLISINAIKDRCESLRLSVGEIIDVKREYINLFSCGYIKNYLAKILSDIKNLYSSSGYNHLAINDAIMKAVCEYNFDENICYAAKVLLAIYAYEQK